MTRCFQISGNTIRLRIYVQPKSSKTFWDGIVERDGADWLKLKVSSPPVDGAANKEIQKFVSKEFHIAKSRVRMIRGEKSRLKVLELEGVDEKKVQAILNGIKPATWIK